VKYPQRVVAMLKPQETALIVRSNYLIEASYRLTVQEQRIILLMASMIQADDEDFKIYRINIRDFMELAGLAGHSKYEDIRQITRKLRERTLLFRKPGSELQIGWLSSAEYFDGKGYVELEFSPKLKPYLLRLKEFFTKYQLKNVMQLKSSYSIRVYELLKQYERIGERHLELSELKEILGIGPEEYPFYANFKQKILAPAQRELINNSDIAFDFKEVKNKRRVVALNFTIKPNKPKNINKEHGVQLEMDFLANSTKRELYKRLQGYFCLSAAQAREIIKNHDEEYILQNLTMVEEDYRRGKIKRLAPYTLKALKEDFRPKITSFELEKEERQKKRQEAQREKEIIERLQADFDDEREKEAEKVLASFTDHEREQKIREFEREVIFPNKGIASLYKDRGLESSLFRFQFQSFLLKKEELDEDKSFTAFAKSRGIHLEHDEPGSYRIVGSS
jgi:plasmid replication initiation protein